MNGTCDKILRLAMAICRKDMLGWTDCFGEREDKKDIEFVASLPGVSFTCSFSWTETASTLVLTVI